MYRNGLQSIYLDKDNIQISKEEYYNVENLSVNIKYNINDIKETLEGFVKNTKTKINANSDSNKINNFQEVKFLENYLYQRCGLKIKFIFDFSSEQSEIDFRSIDDLSETISNNIYKDKDAEVLKNEIKNIKVELSDMKVYGFPLNKEVNLFIGSSCFHKDFSDEQSSSILFGLLASLFSGLNLMLETIKTVNIARGYSESCEAIKDQRDKNQKRKHLFESYASLVSDDIKNINIFSESKNTLNNVLNIFRLSKNTLNNSSKLSLKENVDGLIYAAGYSSEINYCENNKNSISIFRLLLRILYSIFWIYLQVFVLLIYVSIFLHFFSILITFNVFTIKFFIAFFVCSVFLDLVFSELKIILKEDNDFTNNKELFIKNLSNFWETTKNYNSNINVRKENKQKINILLSSLDKSLSTIKSNKSILDNIYNFMTDTNIDNLNLNSNNNVSLQQGLK